MTPDELAAIRGRDAQSIETAPYFMHAYRDRRALLAHIDDLTARLAAQGRDVCDFDYPAGSAPCMCYFSTAEKRGPDPIGECDYHANLRKRLAECERDAEFGRDCMKIMATARAPTTAEWSAIKAKARELLAAIDAAQEAGK